MRNDRRFIGSNRGAGPWPAASRLVSTRVRVMAPTQRGASRRVSTPQTRVSAPRCLNEFLRPGAERAFGEYGERVDCQ
jgi:hypothetical protein